MHCKQSIGTGAVIFLKEEQSVSAEHYNSILVGNFLSMHIRLDTQTSLLTLLLRYMTVMHQIN
jgi:hypothetical protein